MRRVLATCILAILLAIAGCQFAPPDKPGELPPAELTRMPDFKGQTLYRARQVLESSDVSVSVQFPAVHEKYSVPATVEPDGVARPAHVIEYSLPERSFAFRGFDGIGSQGGPDHLIIGQSVPPGTSLGQVKSLALVAGPHPNTTGVPWIEGHVLEIARGGASQCLMCHRTTDCTHCHTTQGR